MTCARRVEGDGQGEALRHEDLDPASQDLYPRAGSAHRDASWARGNGAEVCHSLSDRPRARTCTGHSFCVLPCSVAGLELDLDEVEGFARLQIGANVDAQLSWAGAPQRHGRSDDPDATYESHLRKMHRFQSSSKAAYSTAPPASGILLSTETPEEL